MDPVGTASSPSAGGGGRAGRDLGAAVAVGAGLVVVVLATLFTVKQLFLLVVAVAVVLAVRELAGVLKAVDLDVPLVPVAVGGAAMVPGAYYGGPEPLLVIAVATVLAVLVWRLAGGSVGYARDSSAGALATLYVPLLAAFAALMLRPADGPARVLTFIIVTICSDVGGYAIGVLMGRHPMAPTVSPNKSWEGAAGSLVVCVVGGWVSVTVLLGGAWWQGIIVGAAATVTATVGDLTESMIKRDAGVKDMGSLLPGHGGVMDRLDSLLPTAPVVYLLLSWMVTSPPAL